MCFMNEKRELIWVPFFYKPKNIPEINNEIII